MINNESVNIYVSQDTMTSFSKLSRRYPLILSQFSPRTHTHTHTHTHTYLRSFIQIPALLWKEESRHTLLLDIDNAGQLEVAEIFTLCAEVLDAECEHSSSTDDTMR